MGILNLNVIMQCQHAWSQFTNIRIGIGMIPSLKLGACLPMILICGSHG